MENAKQKSKELIEKFYLELKQSSNNYDEETARQCALIAVNEIIPLLFSDYKSEMFWQEVKEEI